MRPGVLLGCLFLVVAFVAAAAELLVRTDDRSLGIVAAYDLLYTLYPADLILSRIFIQKNIHPFLWDPIMVSFLRLPAWLIIGIPGVILLWRFRPRQEAGEEEDLPYTTYEEVLAAAQEAADLEAGDLSSKYEDLEDFDPARPAPEQESAPEAEQIERKNS